MAHWRSASPSAPAWQASNAEGKRAFAPNSTGAVGAPIAPPTRVRKPIAHCSLLPPSPPHWAARARPPKRAEPSLTPQPVQAVRHGHLIPAITPASVSPETEVASPMFPPSWRQSRPDGVAIPVVAPFRATTALPCQRATPPQAIRGHTLSPVFDLASPCHHPGRLRQRQSAQDRIGDYRESLLVVHDPLSTISSRLRR